MTNDRLRKKGIQAQLCYENLKKLTRCNPERQIIFRYDSKEEIMFKKACKEKNPFPSVLKPVLFSIRSKAIKRLFEDEKVLQTGPAAAILALDAALAADINDLRAGTNSEEPIVCDIGFAGLQVIRLYMMYYENSKEFVKSRYSSAIRVDNALNGSFYKYPTKDGRQFSAHVYYESQKAKMMQVLGMRKKPEAFSFMTLPFDKKITTVAIRKWQAEKLEEAAFEAGACGCMLRDRDEWEESEVGKAVDDMPLFRLVKTGTSDPKVIPNYDPSVGPLSGLKVLDLTHIIAGPACTRLLAEAGADVLMIRRGRYVEQEQAMLELDGWAGKRSVQLDFNIPEQLERAKDLIRKADVVVTSYQYGALDHFGLSEEDIRGMNPNVIYGSMVCFSDTVWRDRPGWAPCAEDITGLSVRNGSLQNPVNLNGVPLDYIPGFILACGILKAIKLQMEDGGGYTVHASLTRGGYWLHECTDLFEECAGYPDLKSFTTKLENGFENPVWKQVYHPVKYTPAGDVWFPAPATAPLKGVDLFENMKFTDGCTDFRNK